MSRKTVPNTIAGLTSLSSRTNNSSLPAGESLALNNPYILHEHIPNQTSHTKRHHRESSRLGPESAGGSGKDGRSSKSGHRGGDQEETDSSSDSSSSQDDEETDDDEDADDADEPAVNRPARAANGDHRAGQGSRKRSFEADIDGLTEGVPEQNRPNKRVAFDIDASDDEDIEGEEEDAIVRELENGVPPSTPIKESPFPLSGVAPETIDGFNLGIGDVFEDLNDEMFISQWNDPSFFPDIPCDPMSDCYLFNEDIFSVNPTPNSTPAITPDNTPWGSFSATAPYIPASLSGMGGFHSSTAGSDAGSSDEDEAPTLNPFFEKKDPAVKHLVSIQGRGGWADDTDDDVDVPWGHFFSSDESGDEGGEGEEEAVGSESEDESGKIQT